MIYVRVRMFSEFRNFAVFSKNFSECSRFIGYPASTGVLYFILYSDCCICIGVGVYFYSVNTCICTVVMYLYRCGDCF